MNISTNFTTEDKFQSRFYIVESTFLGSICQLTALALILTVVLIHDTIIIRVIVPSKKLHTPAHWMVVKLLVLDCVMLIVFTGKMFYALLNGGYFLHEAECKLMYFLQRLLRGFQIGNYALIALEKAVFIIVPFKYQTIFETRIPLVLEISTYTTTSVISLSCFFESVRFLPGPLACSNSVFAKNSWFLTFGLCIRTCLALVCISCLVAVSAFAANFNIKERKRIQLLGKSIQRALFYGMLRNIVITSMLTFSWTLQWALIGLMNDSKNKNTQGRIAAILYHTLVATVNPIMIRLFYKPIKIALKKTIQEQGKIYAEV